MKSADIRQRFIDYFARHGHRPMPSSSLVPADDPTLLFTNAGMVQFKKVFLGEESLGVGRAVTSQKCLRVSGKHNDLEEVGVTSRHHTFFEMLGNFSFGDYFKRDAIRFAWELITDEYGLPHDRLWVTVHHTDDEAAALWSEVAGLPSKRIFRLGDKDNFWQMGETGPCGPCSEIHFDLRPVAERGDVTVEQFEALGSAGRFLELWNLVFMQFDRAADGTMTPLPAPSIDTGAGLERLASVLQETGTNYGTDLFMPLIERAVATVGIPYEYDSPQGVSYRVLADHARAVSFLLADGVIPSNEGRGYVLRRILRRAVRHAWLLGRREPTLMHVADRLIDGMAAAYPELAARREHILDATRLEEERFLDTIDSGMQRIDEIAPRVDVSAVVEMLLSGRRVVSGDDAFKLHDTFGFPVDLTELIARERGYDVDVKGFEAALEAQRERSRQDRRIATSDQDELSAAGWIELVAGAAQEWVGYDELDVTTDVLALWRDGDRVALVLARNPFYHEAGGQVDDSGRVEGDGWSLTIEDVRRVGGRIAVVGHSAGALPASPGKLSVRAIVDRTTRRDTQRNHTATHLLHAALRSELGTHVVQRGSLVAPDRLRFDFAHGRPLSPDEIRRIEEVVNRDILADAPVETAQSSYEEAVGKGAMALFGEKYADVVRVVSIPGISMELCGGCHVRHTGDIGQFRIVSENGIAAGIRRIEAVTGSGAYRRAVERDRLIEEAAALLRTTPDVLPRRIEQITEENRELRRQLERAREAGSGDLVARLVEGAAAVDGMRVVAAEI
ncbi:MAG: alanine--tRNA ligase, partial [Gemmatimonadetes bacterium]|nr:alanine--tRNA ligase [Gemmatimonadota bacterium]